jgi:hypothetical protein
VVMERVGRRTPCGMAFVPLLAPILSAASVVELGMLGVSWSARGCVDLGMLAFVWADIEFG